MDFLSNLDKGIANIKSIYSVFVILLLFIGYNNLLSQEIEIKKVNRSINSCIHLLSQWDNNKRIEAIKLLEDSLQNSIKLNYLRGEAYALYYLGFSYAPVDPSRSKEYVQGALSSAQRIGDLKLEAYASNLLGKYYYHSQEYEISENHLLSAIDRINRYKSIGIYEGDFTDIYNSVEDFETETDLFLYNLYHLLNETEKAIVQSNKILSKNISPFTRLRHLIESANLYLSLELLDRAQVNLDNALELAEKENNLEQANRAKSLLGGLYFKKEEYQKAINILIEALNYFHNKDIFIREQAAIRTQIGNAYLELHNYDQAEIYFIDALNIFENTNDLSGLLATYTFLGSLYEENRDYFKAIDFYQKSLQKAKELNDKDFQYTTTIRIAMCNFRLGDIISAERDIESALTYYSEIDDNYKKYQIYFDIGKFYVSLGYKSKSLDFFLLANKYAEEIRNDRALNDVYIELCSLYLSLGDYYKALSYGTMLIAPREVIAPTRTNINSLLMLARLRKTEGDNERALKALNIALLLAKKQDNPSLVVQCLIHLGDYFHGQNKIEKTLSFLNEALQISGKHDNQLDQLSAHLYDRLASCYFDLNIIPTAQDFILKAIKINLEEKNNDSLEWEYYLLGLIKLNQNNKDEAYSDFKKSIEIKNNLRINIREKEYKSFFTQYKPSAFEEIISLLLDMKDIRNQPTLYEEAFYFAENGKARSFVDLIFEKRYQLRTSIPKEILENLDTLYKKADLLEKQYSLSKSKEEIKLLLKDQINIEEEIRDIEQEVRKVDKLYSSIIYPEPISVDRAQAEILGDDQTAILEYYLGFRHSFVFVITKNQLSVARLNKTNIEYTSDVKRLRSVFENNPSFSSLINENCCETDISRKLFREIVSPVMPFLDNINRLIIIPHGCLCYLPFEILVLDDKQKTSMLEKYAISYANSVSLLEPGLYSRTGTNDQKGQLLAYSNPAFQDELAQGAANANSSSRLPNTLRGKLSNLKFTMTEVNQISELFNNVTIRSGTDATKRSFLEDAPFFPFIHVATHAIINEDKPLYSGLVFSFNKEVKDIELLTAYEAFNINLNCDLMVLSACQTGLGQDMSYLSGEGVSGLSQAFNYAGARSLLVSLWEVEDESTSILLSDFYRFFLENGMDKARALQQAKILLMNREKKIGNLTIKYKHPFFWGPFILTGSNN